MENFRKRKGAFSIVPGLAVGGIGSMYATKGLFWSHRMLQQTMRYGIDWIKENTSGDQEIAVVPPALLTNTEEEAWLQRKDASCGCMLLTRTGIFYIQAGDLRVFKASPWGQRDTLQTYQEGKTALSLRAREMYESACQNRTATLSKETDHLLLHMILSDIQTLCNTDGYIPLKEFKMISEKLVNALLEPQANKTSQTVLEKWIDDWSSSAQWATWCTVLQNATVPLFARARVAPLDKALGDRGWESASQKIHGKFRVYCERCALDFWHTRPKFEQQRGKWAHVGDMHYALV